ncbi:MAG: cell division protein FtsX [Cyclobacteriaceae bacterium]
MQQQNTKFKKKKKLGSYPYFSVIFSITLALSVIGLFGLLILHASNLSKTIKENIEVQVFLNQLTSENEIIQLEKIIASKNYVLKEDGESSIEFISKEEAARQFTEDTGEDIIEFLGENPLRDVIIFKVSSQAQTKYKLPSIKEELEEFSSVYEVTYVENLVDSINSNVAKISLLLLGFAVILFIAVVILINNTIKLALFSQRFLIRSMQLVGARPSFIKKPFLARSLLYGIMAGLFASAILYGVLSYFNSIIEGLAELQNFNEIIILFGFLVIIGAMVGYFSTFKAINKYLNLSLDELY